MVRKGHGRSRRRFNLRKVRVAASLAIGALATKDVVAGPGMNTSANPYRLMSVDLAYSLTDLAALIDDGQEFGLAHSDYTAAEIEECLESQGAIDIGDKIAQEQANRLVRIIGQFTGAPGSDGNKDFNDGRKLKTKLNWAMGIGDSLEIWVRNASDTVYTTGSNLVANGDMWVKDSV